MKRKKSHKEFVEELREINPNIEVIERYINAHTPVAFRCKVCGHVWRVPPENVLRGTGCRHCMIRERTKPVEVLRAEVGEINPDVKIVGEYINTNTPIDCKCRKCGYEWKTRPAVLLRGSGCPKCAGNAKRTHQEFVEEMKQVNSEVEILGHYVNTDTKIEVRCIVCGHVYRKRPLELLRGGKCPNNRQH